MRLTKIFGCLLFFALLFQLSSCAGSENKVTRFCRVEADGKLVASYIHALILDPQTNNMRYSEPDDIMYVYGERESESAVVVIDFLYLAAPKQRFFSPETNSFSVDGLVFDVSTSAGSDFWLVTMRDWAPGTLLTNSEGGWTKSSTLYSKARGIVGFQLVERFADDRENASSYVRCNGNDPNLFEL